jgi:farnesyl-diphosphate farnesyltransferase
MFELQFANDVPDDKEPSALVTDTSWKFCHTILPDVSRTFALNIPILPKTLKSSVCCGYLLCRIADTIEDRADLGAQERQHLFDLFLELCARPKDRKTYAQWANHWPSGDHDAASRLALGVPHVLAAYGSLPRAHRLPILDCLHEMVEGMRSMTDRRPIDGRVYVCADLEELERYCHYVAGVVGLMLTRLFQIEIGPSFCTAERLDQGRRFGLGLQLTNILKDHNTDRARGVVFVPRAWTDKQGAIKPGPKADLIHRTLSHLDTAQSFSLGVPKRAEGIRLFCLWALWMAAATLQEVGRGAHKTPKISRDEVKGIIDFTRSHVRDDALLCQQYAMLRHTAQQATEKLRAKAKARPQACPDR